MMMDHNYIDVRSLTNANHLTIYQRENNIDQRDNLDELPSQPSVYAICGRVNGKPANARFVGITDNLQKQVKDHFDKNSRESDPCFKEFMLSIKIKELVYEVIPSITREEQILKKEKWDKVLKPECNEELNMIH